MAAKIGQYGRRIPDLQTPLVEGGGFTQSGGHWIVISATLQMKKNGDFKNGRYGHWKRIMDSTYTQAQRMAAKMVSTDGGYWIYKLLWSKELVSWFGGHWIAASAALLVKKERRLQRTIGTEQVRWILDFTS